MKQTVLFILLLAGGFFSTQAQSISKTMTFAGENRSYRVYIPDSYDGSQPVPLVMALHGLGDNASNFQGVGFNQIADTADFIAIYPNALPDPLLMSSGWNTGIHPLNTRDDVGFLNALLDTVMANYLIDTARVYSCGFSLGGFMTYRIACELGDRFAAVASVAGSLPAPSIATCYPGKRMPVLHIHGTSDQVIPYTFGTLYVVVTNLGADSTTHYWAQHNACAASAAHDSLPNTKNDGFIFEQYAYGNCEESSEVILIKVNGMDHTWPSSSNDVNATKEIWSFFSRHSKAEPEDTAGVGIEVIAQHIRMLPNPATEQVLVESDFQGEVKVVLSDLAGKQVYQAKFPTGAFTLNLRDVKTGTYLLTLSNHGSVVTERLIKR